MGNIPRMKGGSLANSGWRNLLSEGVLEFGSGFSGSQRLRVGYSGDEVLAEIVQKSLDLGRALTTTILISGK